MHSQDNPLENPGQYIVSGRILPEIMTKGDAAVTRGARTPVRAIVGG